MAKLVRIIGYFFGILLILIGIVFIRNLVFESPSDGENVLSLLNYLSGPILIIIGALIYYTTYTYTKKQSQREND